MKKVLSLFFVLLFSFSLMNSAPVEEDFGGASDCANYWRNAVITLAENNGDDPNTDSPNGNTTYLEIYMIAYTSCVESL